MRVERKQLEHEGDVACRGAVHRHLLAVEGNRAGRWQLQPCDHAQRRRLAATGRAKKTEKLAVLHREARRLDRMKRSEGFVERLDLDLCHRPYSLTFETMINITVPNRVVAKDQEYSSRKKGCISMTTPMAMIVVATASSGPRRRTLPATPSRGLEEVAPRVICEPLRR